jgi:hypothetical protein
VVERIVPETEKVASDGGDIVRFGRVRDRVELGEENSLLGEGLEAGGRGGGRVVGVLEPDLDEAVEDLA